MYVLKMQRITTKTVATTKSTPWYIDLGVDRKRTIRKLIVEDKISKVFTVPQRSAIYVS